MAASVGIEPTDEQLLAALGRRELGALDALYERHHRLALALAYRMLSDRPAAEDVVQEVFLAVWRQAMGYRPERGLVKTWLLAMVHHRAIDRLRRKGVSGMAELDERMVDSRVAPVWQQAFEQIRGEQIAAALDALPPEQRETIELAYFGGKSQSEIAEMLGVPLGTVKGRTRLALDKLRGLLVGLREEPA
jgi:RNA polymerase sigma-70 factor (ECF subfamily)